MMSGYTGHRALPKQNPAYATVHAPIYHNGMGSDSTMEMCKEGEQNIGRIGGK